MGRAAGQYVAIPWGAGREILLESSDSVRVDRVGGGELVTVRGEQFPLLRLETILGRAVDADDDTADRQVVIVRPGQGQSHALCVAANPHPKEPAINPPPTLTMAPWL